MLSRVLLFERERPDARQTVSAPPAIIQVSRDGGNVESSRLVVDGPLCPEYYRVSRLVKSAFTLV